MTQFDKLAEQRIRDAMERGEFDNLPNAGERLDFDEYFSLPDDIRAAYKLLKDANCVPEEVALLGEIERLSEKLCEAAPDDRASQIRERMQDVRLRLSMLLERRRVRRQG